MRLRALLDVNVLIALLDADHSLHSRATQWFAGQAAAGWASCPITQNGCIRVMSHPGYPSPLPVSTVMQRLGEAAASAHHEFWADDISLLDPQVVDRVRVHGPRQITDVYLLALAVRHKALFATFDSAISTDTAKGAQKRHLLAI